MWHMNDMQALGRRVEDAMKTRGMAAYELAAKIGRQPSWVSRFLNGGMANLPDADTLQRIGEAVGLRMPAMLEAAGYLMPEDATTDVLTVPAADPRARLVELFETQPDEVVLTWVSALEVLFAAASENTNIGVPSDTGTAPLHKRKTTA